MKEFHMPTSILARARRLWNNPLAPAHINRHNQLAWARSVARLGDRWLLAKPIERRAAQ